MNMLTLGITATQLALPPIASFADPLDANMPSAIQSASRAQFAIPAAKESSMSESLAAFGRSSAALIPNLGEATHTRLRVIFVRGNSLRGEVIHNGMLLNNDSIHSTIYVPMRGVNNALSLVGTAMQSKLADSLVTLVQAMSLVARRQVNTELSYTVPINSYSRVDSAIIYRLHLDSNSGNTEIMASLRYTSRF